MDEFRKLGVSDTLLKAIRDQNIVTPTMIQEKAIPLVLEGKDVFGMSATGSGKTLAFGAAIIEKLKRSDGLSALVMTPTRELAEQVTRALSKFSKGNSLKIIPVYGGVSINPQMSNISDANVVVGTPGRLLDHLERRTLDLRKIKILVLDEADRMLDMGFIDDVTKIIRQCPTDRQTLLFSATLGQEIKKIADNYMRNPIKISGTPEVDPRKLKQVYYDIRHNMKISLLVHLIMNETPGLVMVFCNTRRDVDFVEKNLRKTGVDAIAIHGGLSQARRSQVMSKFKSVKVSALICTDVAARGLDIPNVSHIYNYSIPNDSKEYVHRIGRTARAGKEGMVVNLISDRDYDNFNAVLSMHKVVIKKLEAPKVEQVQIVMSSPRRDSGRPSFRDRSPPRGGPRRATGRGPSRPSSRAPSRFSGPRSDRGPDRSSGAPVRKPRFRSE